MKIYIVGHDGPEHNHIESLHQTYKGALEAWNNLRKELIEDARKGRKFCKKEKYDGNDMYSRIIKNLKCNNSKKIDNYPHETPYIREMEVKE